MGDFETSDSFTWTYSIDGGASVVAFASTVDEAGSHIYTLDGGASFPLDDPMLVGGVILSNGLATFSVPIIGTGSLLTLTLTAKAEGGSEAIAFQNIVITQVDNQAPTAVCQDITVSADNNCQGNTSAAAVDNGSTDPDGDAITLSLDPSGPYGLGQNTVTLTVTDDNGATATCEATVEVIDDTPPVIVENSDIVQCLWPPNHEYTCLDLQVFGPIVTDNCDAAPSVEFSNCTSSQPENDAGDGHTVNDCLLQPPEVCLRAERDGRNKDGRTYSVAIAATDASGNQASGESGQVLVPHDASQQAQCPNGD